MKYPIAFALITFSCMIGFSANAQDTAPATPLSEIKKCQIIQKDKARLACFDNFAGTFVSDVEAGNKVVLDKASAETLMKENFGLKGDDKKDAFSGNKETVDLEKPDRVEAMVSRVEKNSTGKMRLYLENGQTWQQVDNTRVPMKKNDQNSVIIRKTSFGSYLMRVNGRKRGIRVKRVK